MNYFWSLGGIMKHKIKHDDSLGSRMFWRMDGGTDTLRVELNKQIERELNLELIIGMVNELYREFGWDHEI